MPIITLTYQDLTNATIQQTLELMQVCALGTAVTIDLANLFPRKHEDQTQSTVVCPSYLPEILPNIDRFLDAQLGMFNITNLNVWRPYDGVVGTEALGIIGNLKLYSWSSIMAVVTLLGIRHTAPPIISDVAVSGECEDFNHELTSLLTNKATLLSRYSGIQYLEQKKLGAEDPALSIKAAQEQRIIAFLADPEHKSYLKEKTLSLLTSSVLQSIQEYTDSLAEGENDPLKEQVNKLLLQYYPELRVLLSKPAAPPLVVQRDAEQPIVNMEQVASGPAMNTGL